ncbi:MAG TPA: GtrA family protein [Methylophilaceae bacterium]|nr:GtrA family protein [Methylophilaceae bacterium]
MNDRLTALKHSATWFTLIGAAAALVHYIVAVALETGAILTPSNANIVGFLCAFPVSYFGHRAFSFSTQKTSHSQAFPRFLVVACGGFLANQLLVVSALHMTSLPFWLVLAVVMVIVAVSTYILSRYWAFKAQ